MSNSDEVAAIRATRTTEIRIVSQEEWDKMWLIVFPTQRRADILLPIAAVFKDGVYYIPVGGLEMKMRESA